MTGVEVENELEPLNLAAKDFWYTAVGLLIDNPDKVLPVYFEHPDTREQIGSYYMQIVRQDSKIFIQVGDFNRPEVETGFVVGSSSEWEKVQPGIYRLEITKEVLSSS